MKIVDVMLNWLGSGDNVLMILIIVLLLVIVVLVIASRRYMRKQRQPTKELEQVRKQHEQHHAISNEKDEH